PTMFLTGALLVAMRAIVFLIFVRAVARCFHDKSLSRKAVKLLLLWFGGRVAVGLCPILAACAFAFCFVLTARILLAIGLVTQNEWVVQVPMAVIFCTLVILAIGYTVGGIALTVIELKRKIMLIDSTCTAISLARTKD